MKFRKTLAAIAVAGLAVPTAATAQSDATRADLECLSFFSAVDGDLPANEKDSEWYVGIGGIVGHFTTRIMARGDLGSVTEQSLAAAREAVEADFDNIGVRCIAEAEIFTAALNKLSP